MTEPVLNYLGVPLSQSPHFGTLAEMSSDMQLYLARTDLATFNLLAVIFPTLHDLSQREMTPTWQAERREYDFSFRRFYKEMATELPNGMTLREAATQLPPAKLQELLSTWVPQNPFTGMAMEAIFKTGLPAIAVQLAELHVTHN